MSVRALLPGLALLTAGAGSVLAFAPFGQFYLAIPSLAVWFWLCLSGGCRQTAWRSYLYGLGWFGAGVSWIQVSAHQFGVPLYSFSVGVTALFVLVLALYFAAAGALGAWAARRGTCVARRLMMLGCAFWLCEWLRSWLATGFPWGAVGYSQVGGPLDAVLPVLGTGGASALVLWLAAGLVYLLMHWRSPRRVARAGLVLVGVTAVLLILGRVPYTQTAGDPVRVALLQGNIPQHLKWAPESFIPTVERYRAMTEEALAADVDLVIWPESAIPAYADQTRTLIDTLHEEASAAGVGYFIGMPRRVEAPADGRVVHFNSVLALGGELGLYDKRHLVPFGEYLPFRSLLYAPLAALHVRLADFVAGPEAQPLLQVGDVPVGMSICFEDVFAGEVLKALPEAGLLVNVSNDAWFGDSLAPHQHMQIAQARALESGRPMLRATNTGVSGVADHRGRLIARSPQFEPDTLIVEVTPRQGMTPYFIWRDWPLLGLSVVVLILGRGRSKR